MVKIFRKTDVPILDAKYDEISNMVDASFYQHNFYGKL